MLEVLLLGWVSVALDVENPWEAHAFFALGFWCEDCKGCLDFDSEQEVGSDEWCVEQARSAFDHGWFIPPPLENGGMDVMSAWCPQCGGKRGLSRPANEVFSKRTT